VVPSVRCNLVAIVVHALNNCGLVVDAVIVLAVHEESTLQAIGFKLVQKAASIYIWAIIKGERERSWYRTAVDDSANWY